MDILMGILGNPRSPDGDLSTPAPKGATSQGGDDATGGLLGDPPMVVLLKGFKRLLKGFKRI